MCLRKKIRGFIGVCLKNENDFIIFYLPASKTKNRKSEKNKDFKRINEIMNT
jgi:hypothetical protein